MRQFILIWPDSHHTPTSIDLATEEDINEIGGFSWDEINAAQKEQTQGWLGETFTVSHDSGSTVTMCEVSADRIAITDRLRDGAQIFA